MAAPRHRALAAAPLLLAFETATARAGAALLRGGALVAEAEARAEGAASSGLLPLVDSLLARAGVALAEVDAFAVSIGPGSFTGLRIGLATVKGLAFGTDRPAVAVPTLEALARPARGAGPVVALLDARRGELYAAGYDVPVPVPEGVYTPAELAPRLPAACTVVGEGARLHGEALTAASASAVIAPPSFDWPRAAQVGAIAAVRLARGEGRDAADLVPHYLRRAEAEVRRTGIRFSG